MEQHMKRANELASDHWGYIYSLLAAHQINQGTIDIVRFHYLSAFVHGYKHAIEDNLADVNPATTEPMVNAEAVYGGGS